MTERPPLSKTEWRIMNHCWRLGKATARQVWERSLEQHDRDYQTVKTLLDRITAKGYLQVEKLGNLCLYTPTVERRAAAGEAVQEFVDVVLDKALAPIFVYLAEKEDLSQEELETLERLLEREESREERRDRG